MKQKLISLLALMMVTLFAGSVFAAQQVEVKVTSEPIAEAATCEKAGGYTMEFDSGTVISDGDQITVDLPLNVTLCNDIDIMIPYSAVDNNGDGDGIDNSAETVIRSLAAYATEDSSSSDNMDTLGDVEFYIHGDAGTQRVTIDVTAATDLTVGSDTGDKFTIKFFDQNIDGVFVAADGDGVYDDAAAIADNTRCINISAYSNETVSDSLDSAGDIYTFIPSNPQVAHVISATGYSLYTCDKTTLNRITLGTKTSTQEADTETCDYFDFESATGYCSGSNTDNKLIIAATADMQVTDYKIELEIMTDGVYWVQDDVVAVSYASTALACADNINDGYDDEITGDGAASDEITYVDADGDPATPLTTDEASDQCDVDAANQAVKLTTPAMAPVGANARALLINVPAMTYDLDQVNAGDEVEIKVTLTKVPCGDVISDTFSVGTFGCVVDGVSYDMSFPYFTEVTGDSFWDGFAIVNKSATDGTAELTIYEADGDVFTASLDVAAHSMAVHNTADLLAIATQTVGSGTLGDARFYMEVSADFNLDGFAMMANPATGESMGYLPRLGH